MAYETSAEHNVWSVVSHFSYTPWCVAWRDICLPFPSVEEERKNHLPCCYSELLLVSTSCTVEAPAGSEMEHLASGSQSQMVVEWVVAMAE
jgi:hypothetical protein